MPSYVFLCSKGHVQNETMSFAEHHLLDKNKKGHYLHCNVRYGDMKHPRCVELAYQQFDPGVGIIMR